MKVLFCTAECDPFVKIGGLGDVSRDLPKALSKLGVDVRISLPLYDVVNRDDFVLEKMRDFVVPYSGEEEKVTVWQTVLPGSEVIVLLFENEEYLSGGGKAAFTGLDSEIRRFGFFDRAVVSWLEQEKYWQPDVLHLNDWHMGLVPQLLKEFSGDEGRPRKNPAKGKPSRFIGTGWGIGRPGSSPATLLTIHNISFQGIADLSLFAETGLSIGKSKVLSWDAQDKNIDFLLQGIAGADVINTVSPTYAKEIMTPEFGEGLNEVLRSREARVYGVLNGVDTKSFNPETDEHIFKKYSVSNWREGKRVNKKRLQEELGLEVNGDTFLLGFVGRLDPDQKGLELVENMWYRVKSRDVQMVLLGVGDPEWEEIFRKMGRKFENFSAQIRFDKTLARKIFAGGDALVMPSKFEPCGLPQMMAMRYGAVPIVRNVGGLKDTVREGENGFTFDEYSVRAFTDAVERARAVYVLSTNYSVETGHHVKLCHHVKLRHVVNAASQDEERAINRATADKVATFTSRSGVPVRVNWQDLVKTGMTADFSWSRSAKEYLKLYREALGYRDNGE